MQVWSVNVLQVKTFRKFQESLSIVTFLLPSDIKRLIVYLTFKQFNWFTEPSRQLNVQS